MKIFFDTEFTGLHKDTTLISIGCVAENGSTFYAELTDYNTSQCDDWINENVIKHLRLTVPFNSLGNNSLEVKGPKTYVRTLFTSWLSTFEDIQFVSDVCHYDMVLLIDLYGNAFNFSEQVNACPACHDINQDIARMLGYSDAKAFDVSREELVNGEIEGDKHNALYDAQVIKRIYENIVDPK